MNVLRRQLRACTWIAILAIFGLALAPTISRAMSAGGGAPWSAICSTAGTPAAPDDGASGHAGHVLDHCALCAVAAAPMGLPPAAAVLVLPDLAEHVAELFGLAPRPLFAWAAAQPRGPPSLS